MFPLLPVQMLTILSKSGLIENMAEGCLMISVYAYPVFGSVLACAKSAHMFQKLSNLLCGIVSN